MVEFAGFTPELYRFFEELEAHNERAWFQDNKDRYEAAVRAPLVALFGALEGEFGTAKVFRIYRDTRFSRDKTPYKLNQGGIIDGGARGSWYLSVAASGIAIGMGVPGFDRDQLERYRSAVAGEAGVELEEIVRGLRRWGAQVGTVSGTDAVGGTDLKRVPRPYEQDHPRAELLKCKALVAVREWDRPEWLLERKAVKQVRDVWHRYGAFGDWMANHVGSPNPDLSRRFG